MWDEEKNHKLQVQKHGVPISTKNVFNIATYVPHKAGGRFCYTRFLRLWRLPNERYSFVQAQSVITILASEADTEATPIPTEAICNPHLSNQLAYTVFPFREYFL